MVAFVTTLSTNVLSTNSQLVWQFQENIEKYPKEMQKKQQKKQIDAQTSRNTKETH